MNLSVGWSDVAPHFALMVFRFYFLFLYINFSYYLFAYICMYVSVLFILQYIFSFFGVKFVLVLPHLAGYR